MRPTTKGVPRTRMAQLKLRKVRRLEARRAKRKSRNWTIMHLGHNIWVSRGVFDDMVALYRENPRAFV